MLDEKERERERERERKRERIELTTKCSSADQAAEEIFNKVKSK